MFAIPAATLALLLVLTTLAWPLVFGSRPQHAGSGEGTLSVWQLRARLEADRLAEASFGRHHLTVR